jgi:hypothetical protein
VFIFLNNLNLSIIIAQEYTEQTISIIITDFTIISALKKRFIREKSALDAKPTACVEISASILNSFHTQMCH